MSKPIGEANRPERGRWSSRRKTEVVMRVLRGENLDALSRELGVTAATIAGWRDQFLASGQAGLRSRPADERDEEDRPAPSQGGRDHHGQRGVRGAGTEGRSHAPFRPEE